MDYIWKKPLTLLEGGGCHGDLPGGVCASREEWKSFVKHSTADMRRCAQKKKTGCLGSQFEGVQFAAR